MRTNVFSDRFTVIQGFARIAAFGALAGAPLACSSFSSDDCSVSYTCSPTLADGSAAGAGAGFSVTDHAGGATGAGGMPGRGGSAAAGGSPASSGGHAGQPGSTKVGDGGEPDAGHDSTSDSGSASSTSDAGHGNHVVPDGGADSDAATGKTGPLVCPAGFADCNGDRADGCEVNMANDADHCGACATACDAAGTTARACVAGVCKPTCAEHHADCNADGKDGCEVDTGTTTTSCGACGHACGTANTTTVACSAGICVPTCSTGFADCSAPPSSTLKDDACETDVFTSTNCGGCHQDCQGGTCNAGRCQPVALQADIRSGQSLAVDSKYAYYTDSTPGTTDRRLVRWSFADNAGELLADDLGTGVVATDGTNLYWTVADTSTTGTPNGQIFQLPPGQTVPVAIQSGITPSALAVDGKHVFWSDRQGSVLQSSHAVNAPVVHLFDDPSPSSLVSDGTTLFAASFGERRLFAVPVDGGSLTEVTALNGGKYTPGGSFIGLDATHAYTWFADSNSQYYLYQLTKPSLGGGTQLATGTPGLYAPPVYYSGYVYYAASPGIKRVPVAGGAQTTVVSSPNMPIVDMVVANGTLYWIELGESSSVGSLMKLALY